MNSATSKTRRRGAISLAAYVQASIVASALIGGVATAGVLAWSNSAAARTDASALADHLGRHVATDLVAGAPVDASAAAMELNVKTFKIVDPQGELVAGDAGFTPNRWTPRRPIEHAGRTVGAVYVDAPLMPGRGRHLVPFLLALALLVCAALSFSQIVGGRLRRASRAVLAVAERSASSASAAAAGSEFAEFRRMQIALERTVNRMTSRISRLTAIAYLDADTRLANRTQLFRAMDKVLPKASFDRPAALIYLDLEGFHRSSEVLGADATRELRAAVAARLVKAAGETRTRADGGVAAFMLASLQSDAFGLLLPPGTSRDEASSLVRSLRLTMQTPFELDGRSITLGLSGGIAMAPEDADTGAELIRRAESALKQAQNEDRGGFQFYTPRLDRLTKGRYRLEAELREAVARGEFTPVFQPKVEFATGRIVGAEALARWNRPEGRTISPGVFIPLAEETGLIAEIGDQVLKKSCIAAANWMRRGLDVRIAVNVSPCQFEKGDFTNTVLDALRYSGLPPTRLELEITETMAISNPQNVIDVMRPLRAMGVGLAIDDFGTGHANLSALTRLPFDVFKIDRQFVSALEVDRQAPAIIEMILAMAETLGLQTIAEGVETPVQAEFLKRRGCTLAQGFLYSQGVSHQSFVSLVDEWRPALAGKAMKQAS